MECGTKLTTHPSNAEPSLTATALTSTSAVAPDAATSVSWNGTGMSTLKSCRSAACWKIDATISCSRGTTSSSD